MPRLHVRSDKLYHRGSEIVMKSQPYQRLLSTSLIIITTSIAAADLTVTKVNQPPAGPRVLISQPNYDGGGTTSIRFVPDSERELKTGPQLPNFSTYVRDRDLGQSFTIPAGEPVFIDAVTLRIGPSDNAIKPGAHGAAVSLQLFHVTGQPVVHDNGTTTPQHLVSWTDDPRTDDYITGEIYTSLCIASGGTLPADLQKDNYMRWDLTGEHELRVEPGERYGFMILFDAPASDQAIGLANVYWGTQSHAYDGGHGLRREGSVEEPWLDTDREWDTLENSSLPLDWEQHVLQSPNTWGRPDVCTWRDLCFYIETKSAADVPPPANLNATWQNGHVQLTWTDLCNVETGYIIQRKPLNHSRLWQTLDTLPPDSTTYTDTHTLYGMTNYTYRVGACR